MTEAISKVIDKIIDPVILIFALVVLAMLIIVARKLSDHARLVSEKLFSMKSTGVKQSRALDLKQRAMAVVKREDLYPLRKTYDEIYSQYNTWSQMIPIFPLLGILGTVAGLILQVMSQDAQLIYQSLHLALSSTLYGILAAIVLKIVEAACVQKHINDIDSMLSDYEIKYQDQRDLNSQAAQYDEE